MKKIFILLFAIITHLAVFSQSNYSLKFEENEFSFFETKMGYQILSKSVDYYLLGDTTLPALPYKTIHILIPENTDVENVSISIKSREIRQNIYLISNPVEKPVSTMTNNSNSNVGNYSEKMYPDKNLKFETVIKSQGFYMAAFSVCPFIYDAQKRSLELITEMDISFSQNRKTTTESTNSSVRRYDMQDFIKSLVINPEEINALYSQQIASTTTRGTTNDIEYLIITSENLKENFNPLKAWKIRKGVKTEILSTSYIYANYQGTTNQLKIKNCLKDYYTNKNLKWVLLGGDNTVVPVQMCYIRYGDNIDNTPCDLFFACFDNAFDWDANSNGIIGEINDNIDMAPEIYISRAPIRTAEHIKTFVDKTLEYETNPITSNYVKTMLLTGVEMDKNWYYLGESDVHQKSEQMYSNYITPYWANAVKTKFYDTGTDFSGGANYDVTATNLQTVLNNGYHFVHMATHGGVTAWGMETGGNYTSTNAQNQTNSKQSIIVTTAACHTNAFDSANDPCLSEAFIRNPNGGALLYWGSSRDGWTSASWSYSRRFFQKFFSGELDYKFGAVTAVTKSYFISISLSNSTERWLQFTLNSIGDPELSIYTENPSKFTSATVSQSGTTVTVNTGGISDCTIALTSMDFGTTYFEIKKNVSSTTFTNVNCPYYVTITKHNYAPYQYPEDVYIQNFTFNHDAFVVGRNIYVGNNVKPSLPQGDVVIQNGANVIFEATQNVVFDAGFECALGGTFEVVNK